MNKVKAAVFASGTGSNFEAIMEADLPCHIEILVCNKKEAPVIQKAKKHGIHTFVFDPSQYETRAAFEKEIVEQLKSLNVEWIFLAGYMRLIGETILDEYPNRILNIHPSLLPNYPGKDAIQRAFDDGITETGVTVHFVDSGMDTGPIIDQVKVSIEKDDNLDSLTEKIHNVEHKLYPNVIRKLIENE